MSETTETVEKHLQKVEAETYFRERTLTLRQEFDVYMTRPDVKKSEDEETDAFKYLLIASAYRDLEDGKVTEMVIWMFKKAATIADLEKLVLSAYPETTKTLNAMKKNGGALKYIDFVDNQAKALVSELTDVSVKVSPDEVKDGGFVDRKVLERAIAQSGEKVNVVTVRRDENDAFMQKSRKAVQQALAYLHGGMQMEELEKPDDSNTNKALRVEEALETASAAIEFYRHAVEDPITRADGDPSHFVMYTYADYYSSLPAHSLPPKNLSKETWFIEEVYLSTRNLQVDSCNTTLHLLPVLDCAVFVPLLALMWNRHAMPRIVEFSRIYRIYCAALTVCKTMCEMPTERSQAAEAKKLARKIAKMQKQDATITPNPNPAPSERMTAEKTETIFRMMREGSLEHFRSTWRALFQIYLNEKLKHSDRGEKDLVEYTSMFSSEKTALDPHLIEKWYYGRVWYESQQFCLNLLSGMELAIFAHLQDYLNIQHHEMFRTRVLLPYADHTNSLTESLVKENNAAYVTGRQELWNLLQTNAKFKKAAPNDLSFAFDTTPLEDSTAIDDEIVFPDQPWSPTFAQMKAFHRDNCKLLYMSAEQQTIAVSVWAQKK
jgi:hypothetical protein